MKQITFFAILLATFTVNAQIFFDGFEDGNIDGWTLLDEDGDGNNFRFSDSGIGIAVITSESWNGTALTPDNYAVSPAIDITGGSSLSFSYRVAAQDPLFPDEFYTMYVSTGNTVADFLNPDITVSFSENIGDDPDASGAGVFVDRTIDISALEGNTTIFIAIRHHNSTDQFRINFDDFSVVGEVLSTDEFSATSVNHYIQGNDLIVTSDTQLSKITLINLLGQPVMTEAIDGNEKRLNIESLSSGTYIASVSNQDSNVSFKFIKN